MKLAIQLTTATFLLAATLVFALFVLNSGQAHANAADGTFIGAATTTQAISVTTSTRIMATSTSVLTPSYTRVYAVICNPNSNPVWLNLNNDKATNLATGDVTTVIAAAAGYNACYEITNRNLYQGSITASSTGQTATTITAAQYVQ